MIKTPPVATLEAAIRQSGEGWLVDWFSPREQALPHLREILDAINVVAKRRLGKNAPDFSEETLVSEFNRSPHKVRGFFQILGGTRTPEMLLMAWRIIQGMQIKEIKCSYRRLQEFEATVVLESPYGEEDETYVSKNIHDFSIFRHIGMMEAGGRPVFDGFYAMNLKTRDRGPNT